VQASEDNSLPRANDRFLWGEVAEAMFSSIASARQLTPTTGARPFDLVVSFPSGDKPDVALTFGEKEEIETRKQVLDTITGVEGFVVQDGKGGVPGIMVTLTGPGSEHGFAPQTTDQRGYFLFSRVSVDPDLGSEFTVKAHQVDPEKILSETKLILERGRRARVLFHVPIVPESKGPTGAGTAQLVDAVLGGLPGTFPGLAEAMKKQALRVGVAFGTNDDSVETQFAGRSSRPAVISVQRRCPGRECDSNGGRLPMALGITFASCSSGRRRSGT
jgi:hypothetical protein